MEYYETQRSVLRSKPHLRGYLKRCRHCRIFFLTEPSNVDRDDLGCPFGCSESHRRREASRRSAAYYRTEEGRVKKRALNRKRYLLITEEEREPVTEGEEATEEIGVAPIVEHVRMVTGLIEGRFVSLNEIREMLKQKERQHSLTRRKKLDYIVEQLNKDPP